jgi:hypothetical protein
MNPFLIDRKLLRVTWIIELNRVFLYKVKEVYKPNLNTLFILIYVYQKQCHNDHVQLLSYPLRIPEGIILREFVYRPHVVIITGPCHEQKSDL